MTPLLALELAALGAVAGSGFATLGLRLAQARPWLSGRSACDACGHALGYAETIPMASFVVRHGACRHCGVAIPRLHLFAEMLGAALLPLLVGALGAAGGGLVFALAVLLLAASVVDAKVQRLPDALTAAATLLCGALAILAETWRYGLAAGLATLSVLQLLRWIAGRRGGDPGLGLGDVKLITALALWLGPWTPIMVALAAGLGLAALPFRRGAGPRLAFGPFIAGSAIVVGSTMTVLEGAIAWP